MFAYTLARYLLCDLPGSGYFDVVFSHSSFSSADSENWLSSQLIYQSHRLTEYLLRDRSLVGAEDIEWNKIERVPVIRESGDHR